MKKELILLRRPQERGNLAFVAFTAMTILALIIFGRGDYTKADQTMEFSPSVPDSAEWVIPISKIGAGEALNAKIGYLYLECIKTLKIKPQCVRIVALVDHESAGSWDPAIVGDGGCSVGIAQWNWCVKRRAPKDFNGQVAQIISEMGAKFARHTLDDSTCMHNSPAMKCGNYVSKVLASETNFK